MSRVNTRPGVRASAVRISNSTNVVATVSPSRTTVRFVGSIRRPRTSIGCSSSASGWRHAGAPQRGLHARAELAHRERLGDVVVGAELEAEHLVDLLRLGREHDDRHRRALRAQPLADLEAVHPRQHQVEHHEVELLLGEARERLAAVGRLHDLVAVALEREREQCLDRLLVVDEQDAGGAVGHVGSVSRIVRSGSTLVRVLDVRVYRAAFLPALVALFVAAFSLADRPHAPRSRRWRRDAFSGERAFGGSTPLRNSLARARPTRSRTAQPASADDTALADRVASTLAAPRPTRTGPPSASRARARARRRDRRRRALRPVEPPDRRSSPTATRRGRRARPSCRRPRRCSSWRACSARASCSKTLVLVSTSGATDGLHGRARVGATAAEGRPIDAVLVLGDLAGARAREPWVVPWSLGSRPGAAGAPAHGRDGRPRRGRARPAAAARIAQWMRRAAAVHGLRAGRDRRRRAAGRADRRLRRARPAARARRCAAAASSASAAACCAR